MAIALRAVIETQSIPIGNTYSLLMHLVALSLAAVPAMRGNMGQTVAQIAEMVWKMTLSDPENYCSTLESMRESGRDVSNYPDYEHMKKILNCNCKLNTLVKWQQPQAA